MYVYLSVATLTNNKRSYGLLLQRYAICQHASVYISLQSVKTVHTIK